MSIHATYPCPCCMFISMLHEHVHGACPCQWYMSTSMLAACLCPWCMSTSMVHVRVHVYGACPSPFCLSMSMLHVHVHAASPCPYCMSMSMYILHFHVYVQTEGPYTCPSHLYMPMPHVHAHAASLYSCCMFMSMSVLLVCVHPAYLQCMYSTCSGSCEPGSRCHPNECIFGGEKPRGVGILESGIYEQREMGRAVYKQTETKVDGSCHSSEGSK